MHSRFLLSQLIFEGNLEDRTGFISIGALYFTDGYCSPEPEAAARRGEVHKIFASFTKREVEMAGYWLSSFLGLFWNETKPTSRKAQRKIEANIQPF